MLKKVFKSLLFILFFIIVFSSCKEEVTSTQHSDSILNYFPLEVGNEWVFSYYADDDLLFFDKGSASWKIIKEEQNIFTIMQTISTFRFPTDWRGDVIGDSTYLGKDTSYITINVLSDSLKFSRAFHLDDPYLDKNPFIIMPIEIDIENDVIKIVDQWHDFDISIYDFNVPEFDITDYDVSNYDLISNSSSVGFSVMILLERDFGPISIHFAFGQNNKWHEFYKKVHK